MQLGQILVELQAECRRALPDLERGKRVHVQTRYRILDRSHDGQVVIPGEGGMNTALQADLGRAAFPRLLATTHDLLVRNEVRRSAQVRSEPALRERAEAATEVTDVRVLDVAGDDVADLVPAYLPP